MPARRWSRRLSVAVLGAAFLSGCGTTAINLVTGRQERTVMDEATEITAGRKAHQQVLAECGAYAGSTEPRLGQPVKVVR